MTAIIVVCQPRHNVVHVVTDAAIYQRDQAVVAFGNKVSAVPHWPGIVTSAGNAAATPLFGWDLAQQFSTFDDLIRDGEAMLPEMCKAFGLPSAATMIFAGISADRGPEAYSFRTEDVVPPMSTREELEASECYDAPFKLVKLPAVVMTPVPSDQSIPAKYKSIDVDADPESVLWSMRKVLTMQRHMSLPDGLGGIGGFGQLTTVSADGIAQRIIERWPDVLGAPLRPGSIDWKQWHADNPKPGTGRVPLRVVG